MPLTSIKNCTQDHLNLFSGCASIIVGFEGEIAPGRSLNVDFEEGQTLAQYRVEEANGFKSITFSLTPLIAYTKISIVSTAAGIHLQGVEARGSRPRLGLRRLAQLFRF